MNPIYPHHSCPSCPWNRKPILGEGPQPCSLLFLGEGPARDEVKQNRPFAGRTGREFDLHYLPLAGLVRHEVRVDNATHCPMAGYENPTHEMARACSKRHLPQELRHTQPELVVLMGGVACSLADTPIDLEVDYGYPQSNSLLGGLWEGEVFPMFHPAAGLHEGQMIRQLREGFANLGAYLKGRLQLPQDEFPDRSCRLLRGAGEVQEVLDGYQGPLEDRQFLEVAIDTEGLLPNPWCLSFSLDPRRGYVILAEDREGVAALAYWMSACLPLIVLHHSLHDIPVLRAMGVEVPRWRDTMVDAYHLADLPQGLKALGWRLLGVRMKSYEDVVLPHSLPVALSYLAEADAALRPALTFQHQLKSGPRKGQLEERVLPGVDTPTVRAWRKVQKALREEGADPWKRWDGWHDSDRALLRGVMGRELPKPSIAYVPLEEAVDYACLDAIMTLRLHHNLSRRRVTL